MAEIAAAVELGRAGDAATARARLDELWTRMGPTGDPAHRCALAHWAADLQDDPREELTWDERALDVVEGAGPDPQLDGFLPSLHLNLADVHRRLGDVGTAQTHLRRARDVVGTLPADGYGQMVRTGIDHVAQALAQGSTDRLPGVR
ncbi:hypothetical protein GB931_01755 [Modestobacter sp. I12A-02628]|nr:hypothetical protein [Goekera deserti]